MPAFRAALPPRLIALADDLTGANALAAALAVRGYRASTALRPPSRPVGDAQIVDLGARDATDVVAAARVRRAMAWARRSAPEARLALRIDSTMRGPIMAMLVAALSELPDACAVLTPAMPAAGRVVRNGVLHPPTGVAGNVDVLNAARRALGLSVVHLPLARLRGEPAVLRRRIRSCAPGVVLVADAETDDDLSLVAQAVVQSERTVITADAGALTTAVMLRASPPPHRVIALLGTHTTVSARQRVLAQEALGVSSHELSGTPEEAAGVAACNDAVCIVYVAGSAPHRVAVPALTGVARAVLPRGDLRALFLSGGDTARHICRALGAHGVDVERQVASLVAFGRLRGGPWHGLPVITKGGMVGDEATLLRCLQMLQGEDHHG